MRSLSKIIQCVLLLSLGIPSVKAQQLAPLEPMGTQVFSYFPQIANGGGAAQKWITSFTFFKPASVLQRQHNPILLQQRRPADIARSGQRPHGEVRLYRKSAEHGNLHQRRQSLDSPNQMGDGDIVAPAAERGPIPLLR
jgi:hypothetical protein